MTSILGFSDVLLESLEREDDIVAADTVKRNGNYLLELINDILDLSKIEAGKFDVQSIACSPTAVVADVASLMRVRADSKNLPLTVEYAGPIPETIQCDPTRLRQVLINLVGNAVKFTETGSVRLVTRLLQEQSEPPRLRFDVIDTGIGIAADHIPKLFHPFMQADSSTSRKFGGTGLGLTISKRLAEMLGGDISVDSVRGQGSTFGLTVATGSLDGVRLLDHPAEAAVQKQRPPDDDPMPQVRLDCRVLLAEDGPDNRRLIAFLLKKAGAEVEVAENGQIACEHVSAAEQQERPFDVIVMDIQMPVMDGFEATRALRDRGYGGPILALTANAMVGDDQRCREAGCDDYLAKPLDRDRFLQMVAHYAQQQRPLETAGDSSTLPVTVRRLETTETRSED